MPKRGPMDAFIKKLHNVSEDENNLNADDDNSDVEELPAKRLCANRKYDPSYIQLGFICKNVDGEERPMCVICGTSLSKDAMKPSKLKRHLSSLHKDISTKPKEYFERKIADMKDQQKQIFGYTRINICALRASYKVALRIARAKKPFTIAETLVQDCLYDVCLEMLGESAAKTVAQVPLSNDTISRRIDELAEDMEEQLIQQIKLAKYFSLQLDESTDVANLAILIVYVRFEYAGDIKEEFFFSVSLPTSTTSSEIFKAVKDYIVVKCGLDMKFCVGVCSDGAASMIGRHSGVTTKIKELAPECKSTHCFLHRESLATKKMSAELNSVLTEVVTIVNYVKSCALNSRLFTQLCDNMGFEHDPVLLHAEIRWLSRGKVLTRVFELRNELFVFLRDKKPCWSQLLKDTNWIVKLAYLADIYAILNDLTISMQGNNVTCFIVTD